MKIRKTKSTATRSGVGATHKPSDLIAGTTAGSKAGLKISAASDLQRLSTGARKSVSPIQFGSPSSGTSSRSSSQGSDWTRLLEKAGSGSLSDLLGGGSLLSDGLTFLTSGLQSLFGGNSTPTVEPLARFALPDAQGQTLYRNGTALSTVQRGLAEQRFAIEGSTKSDVQANQLQQAKIVQTIKNALLTSSSLNDVIGEL